MNIPDFVGWIGNIFFILGAILLAKKKISGFWCQILGNAFYLVQSLLLTISSLAILSLILIGINGYAIYEWLKKDKK